MPPHDSGVLSTRETRLLSWLNSPLTHRRRLVADLAAAQVDVDLAAVETLLAERSRPVTLAEVRDAVGPVGLDRMLAAVDAGRVGADAPARRPRRLVFVTEPALAPVPARLADLGDAWETTSADEGCYTPLLGDARRLRGPDGTVFAVVDAESVTETRTTTVLDDTNRTAVGTARTVASVTVADSFEESVVPLGRSSVADAVLRQDDALALSLDFEVLTGVTVRETTETRVVQFLVLTPEAGGDRLLLAYRDRWVGDPEGSRTQPAALLERVAPGPWSDEPLALVFDDIDALRQWLAAPALWVRRGGLDARDVGATTTTTRGDLEGDVATRGDGAPAVPELSAPPEPRTCCKECRDKVLHVSDDGRDQTSSNIVRRGIAGMIPVSSENDLIEKLKKAVDTSRCEGISALYVHGHGGPGRQSVGAGTSRDAARQLTAGDAKVFGLHVKPLLCPGATITFYGCQVAKGAVGTAFLEAFAVATGASVSAWTGDVVATWIEAADGTVTDYKPVTRGTKVTKP